MENKRRGCRITLLFYTRRCTIFCILITASFCCSNPFFPYEEHYFYFAFEVSGNETIIKWQIRYRVFWSTTLPCLVVDYCGFFLRIIRRCNVRFCVFWSSMWVAAWICLFSREEVNQENWNFWSEKQFLIDFWQESYLMDIFLGKEM